MQRHQPLNLVYGLTGLANAAFGIAAIVVALIAIEPFLSRSSSPFSHPPGSWLRVAGRPSTASSGG
jgi:hypothetical protein